MLTAALLAWLWLGASPTMPAMPIDSFDQTPLGDDWPNWGAPFGPAASAVRLAVVDGDRFHAGRLRYAGAHRHLMLPCPDRPLHGQPLAVTLRVCGDGSRNLLSANLLDASGEWLNSQPVRLDWTGWRAVRLDLTKFRSHGLGDGNGQVDLPARLFSLNLEFVGRSDGELLLDDIAVQQQPAPLIAFLAVSLDRPNRAPLYLPG